MCNFQTVGEDNRRGKQQKMKYKIRVFATMDFELEVEEEGNVNHEATIYIENNKDQFKWCFDEINKIK